MLCCLLVFNTLLFLSIKCIYGITYDYTDIFSIASIIPSSGNVVTQIDILDRMLFTMDITIYSFPNNQLENILQVGDTQETERLPGIWLYDSSIGFHVAFSNVDNSNHAENIQIAGNIQLNTKYNIQIEFTQSEYRILIDGQTYYENVNYPQHNNLQSKSVYIGSIWYPPADVLIENFKIQKINPASLCIGYHERYSSWIGSMYDYWTELNGKPSWIKSNGGGPMYIHWDATVAKYCIGNEYDSDSMANGWSIGSDEVDSLNGAKWWYPMLISSKICGLTDPNESQHTNIISYKSPWIAVIGSLLFILIFVNLLLMCWNFYKLNCCNFGRKG